MKHSIQSIIHRYTLNKKKIIIIYKNNKMFTVRCTLYLHFYRIIIATSYSQHREKVTYNMQYMCAVYTCTKSFTTTNGTPLVIAIPSEKNVLKCCVHNYFMNHHNGCGKVKPKCIHSIFGLLLVATSRYYITVYCFAIVLYNHVNGINPYSFDGAPDKILMKKS